MVWGYTLTTTYQGYHTFICHWWHGQPYFMCISILAAGKESSMKMYFNQKMDSSCPVGEDYSPITLQDSTEEDYTPVTLKDSIEKTRQALNLAYAGFDNAIEDDLIDSYIYEINALQKRYKHLTDLACLEGAAEKETLRVHSPIRALVSHVFG